MTDKSYVIWNDEERRKLIDAVFVMRQRDPDSSLISIINRAQERQLPPDRQRNIPSAKSIPWLSDELKERFAEMQRKAKALEGAKSEVQEVKQNQTVLRTKLNELVAKAREEAISRLSFEDLAIELLSRLDTFQRDIEERVSSLELHVSAEITRPVSETADGHVIRAIVKPKMKRILVVGMLPEQANNLRKRFAGRADLRFIEGGDVKSTLPQADHIVLNGKFIAHKTQERVKSIAGNITEIVSGGQSIVAQKIEEIVNRG